MPRRGWCFEGLRGRWPLGGLPFGEVGLALHDAAWASALAAWGGVSLVTFLVVFVNATLVDLGVAMAARWRGRAGAGRRVVWIACELGLVVVLVVAAVGWRPTTAPTGEIRYALLQGNDQNRRLTPYELDHDYLTRRHLALADSLHGHYDLIVFPESALERDPARDAALRADLTGVGRRHGAVVVANARRARGTVGS